jgi:uncharacterized repeat protein (TIGR03803 family)
MKRFRAAAGLMLFGMFFLATATDTSASARLVVLHPFTGADGAFPSASLMRAGDGNFYGTTPSGGAFDHGTVFRMTPAGVVTVLYSFTGGVDGDSPFAAVIQATDGNFWGTTYSGGSFGFGTVFRMTPAGVLSTVHAFASGADGANPRAPLIQATDGNFYGTTQLGGPRNRGTFFGMNFAGTIFFRYAFSGGLDGAFPYAPVIQASNGSLYGTVYAGDFSTFGRVYRFAGGTSVTVVHTFTSGADGANPLAPLVEGADGNFYGTTRFGGAFNLGTAFRMTPSGAVTVIKSFSGGADGATPDTGLIQQSDGNLYGTAKAPAGTSAHGVVFTLNPSGVMTILHAFSGGADGATPAASLIQVAPGKVYGTAVDGGSSGKGLVFQLNTSTALGDFDGDGKADITIFRPSTGSWFVRGSSASATFNWGTAGDIPAVGDYDGDGLTDVAIFRPSTGVWWVTRSSTGAFFSVPLGANGDVPVPGDYDGDGKTDVAIFHPSTGVWSVIASSTGATIERAWGGEAGDVPVPGDYDGDGKTDLAIFRPSSGIWYVVRSSTGAGVGSAWGVSGDIAVPGDYDGDGRTDLAVFRPSDGIWYVVMSSTGAAAAAAWGVSGDIPTPGDYDGDGKFDLAIFRPASTWYVVNSRTGTFSAVTWGTGGDIPILKRP